MEYNGMEMVTAELGCFSRPLVPVVLLQIVEVTSRGEVCSCWRGENLLSRITSPFTEILFNGTLIINKPATELILH